MGGLLGWARRIVAFSGGNIVARWLVDGLGGSWLCQVAISSMISIS
jgi:hypothetical protein